MAGDTVGRWSPFPATTSQPEVAPRRADGYRPPSNRARATVLRQKLRVWRRVAAFVTDTIVLAGLIFLVATALGLILGPVVEITPIEDDLGGLVVYDERLVLATGIAGVATAVVYFIGSWIHRGATPGQRAFGLEVHAVDGAARLTPARALLRWASLGAPLWIGAAVLPGIAGILMAGGLCLWLVYLFVTSLRGDASRGLHDRLAGTRVVLQVERMRFSSIGQEAHDAG